MGLIEANREV